MNVEFDFLSGARIVSEFNKAGKLSYRLDKYEGLYTWRVEAEATEVASVVKLYSRPYFSRLREFSPAEGAVWTPIAEYSEQIALLLQPIDKSAYYRNIVLTARSEDLREGMTLGVFTDFEDENFAKRFGQFQKDIIEIVERFQRNLEI